MIPKARRGFEEDSSNMKTDSPTCSKQALRMVFLTAAMKNWELQSIDISSAFLQGNPIQRNVYLQPPKEYREAGKVWKLKRCIYGLNDAPRSWYDRIRQELLQLNGKMSEYDNALFFWYDSGGEFEGIMVLHVDDFVFCGTKEWEKRVVQTICTTFKISTHYQGSFKYIGLNVSQVKDEVMVNQNHYTESLTEIKLSAERR